MSETPDQIKADIKDRFVRLALDPRQEQKFPVGPASARRLGYVAQEIASLPAPVTDSFAGVGNPLVLGELRPGETILDLGCGAGLDSILAARQVGSAGKVIGMDFASRRAMARPIPRPAPVAMATFPCTLMVCSS